MSLRRAIPLKFSGRTVSDAVDGTAAPAGSLSAATNLIPSPTMRECWICRPGSVDLTTFSGFNAPGVISALRVIGDIAYGMIASQRFPGHDEPFAYDLESGAFLTIDGVTSANTPLTQPGTGEWEPPIIEQIGSRIVVTHPGFDGDTYKIGWFDISEFSRDIVGNSEGPTEVVGNTDAVNFPTTIIGVLPPGYGGATLYQSAVGATITGTNIAANTTILSISDGPAIGFIGDTNATTTISNVTIGGTPSVAGLYVGQVVNGVNMPFGARITAVNGGAFTVTISSAATGTTTGATLWAFDRRIEISNPVTGTGASITFTVTRAEAISGLSDAAGIQPGLLITGSVVPANTEILSVQEQILELQSGITAGSTSVGSISISTSAIRVGMLVSAPGIPAGTTVTAVLPLTITLSAQSTFTGTVNMVLLGYNLLLTANLTGSQAGVTFTITGGSPTQPLWGAGDTGGNNLPSRPLGVAQMNGRAYYVCGDDGIVFSDALYPCQVSNATFVQALKPNNGFPCTAIGPLQLSSLLGGIVQALVVFQRDAQMQQIKGDITTLDLTMNSLPVATGTHAPLSIAAGPKGLFFIAPDGLRLIDFGARVSDPIGQDGAGVVLPFMRVSNPPVADSIMPASRIVGCCNGRNYRVTVPLATGGFSEYWFDLTRQIWSGPHTSTARVCDMWSATFLIAPTGTPAVLRRSDDIQVPGSVYVENGDPLLYEWESALLPDTGMMRENKIVESSIMIALPPEDAVQVNFVNEVGQTLDGVLLSGWAVPQALWGTGIYGYTITGPASGAMMQRGLTWSKPLIFKQGKFNLRGESSGDLVIGNVYVQYQVLGYQMQALANAP